LVGPFLEALKNGKVGELRLPTRKPNDETIQGFVSQGAKAFEVDFGSPSSLNAVLTGCHTVVSTLGTGPGSTEINKALIDAMVFAGIKSFIPSEFGTNHYRISKEYDHDVFAGKRAIYEESKARGLNPIRILCGDILEASFGNWFGLDCAAEVWSLVGDGNVPVAMTSEKDLGRFTLEAVLQIFSQPDKKLSDELEVYSCQMTFREYAQAFDKVAGRPTKLEFIPMEEMKEEYKKTQSFETLIKILFAEGVFDYSKSIANELLNPGGKLWKLKTIQEYAEETDGRPWKDY